MNKKKKEEDTEGHKSRFVYIFDTFSSSLEKLSPTCGLKWPGRNHAQHTSGTDHVQHAVFHMVQRDSS